MSNNGNTSEYNPFIDYTIAKSFGLKKAHECFPFVFPKDMTKETRATVAETITNFFNNEVNGAESAPQLPFELMLFINNLSKEHAWHAFSLACHVIRMRFPNWEPNDSILDEEGSSR